MQATPVVARIVPSRVVVDCDGAWIGPTRAAVNIEAIDLASGRASGASIGHGDIVYIGDGAVLRVIAGVTGER
jgi:hypothetical protein